MGLDNVKHIVLILSGKGGVGKSSVTTQLALSLSLAGRSVGILDIDLTGPSIPRLLGIENAKIKQAPGGWLPVQVHPSQLLSPLIDLSQLKAEETPLGEGGKDYPPPGTDRADPASRPLRPVGALYAISLGLLLPSRSSAVVWRGPKKTAMVRQFLTDVLWPPLDYLLIDTPPGTSDEHISLAETLLQQTSTPSPQASSQLAGAVVVTTPQAVAVSDVRKELSFCRKVGIGVLGVVENMSGYVCECCGKESNLFGKGGGEVMAREFEVIFLGGVPVDGQWGSLVEEGKRPRYGEDVVKDVVKDDGDDDDDDEDDDDDTVNRNDTAENNVSAGMDVGLLVDKYRSCSLCVTFEGITSQLIGLVESGHALGS
ncbi:MAG: hypothetical protein LQ339_007471 [Xanthoria mediterranea]|nr:MAG: hypothetical protein LQ339_007471 [Xanthoria mediterranea]